jgi:cell division septum initiation protein DivIVA
MEPKTRERERRSGADRVKPLLDEIENHVRNARKSFVPGVGYVFDREWMTATLDSLRNEMPAELEQARIILREKNTMMLNAERAYDDMIQRAQDEAAQIRSDAETRAKSYYDQKVSEGEKTLAAYQNQATHILGQAEEQAARLVDESELMARAKVEADELRSRVYEEVDALRQETYRYLDETVADLDEAITLKQIELRRLRQNLTVRGRQEMEGY